MGLGIELQDEMGCKIDAVYDATNLLGKLLPRIGNPSYPMLSSIDPYADTTFNGLQMSRFLPEWAEVFAKAETSEEKELVARIQAFAKRCRDDSHLYLKFIGD
jgi:hypothetical protein